MDEDAPGITTRQYDATVDQLLGRLVVQLDDRGLEVFAVIDHSGEAREAGLLMADTKLVVFGNPATVTPLMLAHPLLALDLPLKILIWETTDQHAFVSYNTPRALAERYELPPDQAEALELVDVIAQSLSPPD